MENIQKISFRFYNDHEVRAVWDDNAHKWFFPVVDIIAAITESDAPRKYWSVLKLRLKKQGNELATNCSQLKIRATDGKRYNTDCITMDHVAELAKVVPSKNAIHFLDWLTYSDNTIDGQSRKKAYTLYESNLLDTISEGTVKGLQQIHAYLFGGLYDHAGQIRTKTISKGTFTFCLAQYLPQQLQVVERMPETTIDEIYDKYVEMNVAHPFMEGNGRSTRIWLDQMLKVRHNCCIDWSKIAKHDYLEAMTLSVADATRIKQLLNGALTNKISDREIFMKGIDYSYYYEQEE